MNSPCSGSSVQDGSKLSQDGINQTTSTTRIVNDCEQTYNHNQRKQSRRDQEANKNKQATREQEGKQNKETTKKQEAKENKQPARDSPDTQSVAEAKNITNASECDVPCADKSADVQGQTSNGVIFEEIVGMSQRGSLDYGIPMVRSVEGSNEAVEGMDDSGRSSMVDRIVAFIVSSYSGSCGRLRFREN